MNRIKWMVLIVVVGMTIPANSQEKDKETMVKKVFSVLKNKDEEAYVKLFPNAETMKALIRRLIQADTAGNIEDMMKSYFDEITDSSLQTQFGEDFRKNIKKAEQKGLDWSRTSFVSYKADSTLTEEDGIKISKLAGKIYFKDESKEYFLSFNEIIWFENEGWYGVDIVRIDEKSKENETSMDIWEEYEDSTSMMAVDSIRLTIDSIATAVEKKPVQNPKQPVKNKPAKSKTQTPARKTE